MKKLALVLFVLTGAIVAQTAPKSSKQPASPPEYSGMYTFVQEGEFVQLTVEDHGVLTGFVSSYSDENGGQKTFVDHFFKQGKLDATALSFTTEVVQNTSFEFKGSIERGDVKSPQDEGYYVLKGTLTQHKLEANKPTSSKSQSVTFKSFPRDADAEESK